MSFFTLMFKFMLYIRVYTLYNDKKKNGDRKWSINTA